MRIRTKNRRNSVKAALTIALLVLAAACGDGGTADTTGPTGTTNPTGTTTTSTPDTTQPTEPLEVAVLIAGSATDGGFAQYMVDAVQAAADAGGVDVTVREQLASSGQQAMEDTVGEYAQQGFDLVIAHGFELVPGVARYAPEYPDVYFATSLPVEGNPPNVAAYLLVFEDFGFAGGFLGCQGTSGGGVAFLNGPDLPFNHAALFGLEQAVDQFCPGTPVFNAFGDYRDTVADKEATLQMIESGADSVFNGVNDAQPGVFAACEESDVSCWANSRYAVDLAPEIVLGTMDYDYGFYVPQWIDEIRNDEWTGGLQFINLQSGAVSVICTDLGEESFPGLKERCDQFNADALAGNFEIETMPEG